MKTCDVVIPTYNNAQVLIRAITAIQAQEVPAGWQLGIVVGDDGSTDNTAHQLKSLKNNQSITYLPGEHSGIAATRNRCLRQSQADVILFLGADILVQQGAVREHINFHDQHPEPQAAAV